MEIELTRLYRFEAARRLTGLGADHPCARVHGHGFELEVVVSGPLDAATGLVVDYAEIDGAVAPLLAQLDHALLNDVDGLENPTSELISVWTWDRLAPRLAGLTSVTVSETPTSRATFRGHPG